MMVRTHKWTMEEIERLANIIASGGSPIRAAAALNRRVISCQKQARKMGTPFNSMIVVRGYIKEKCQAAAREDAGR